MTIYVLENRLFDIIDQPRHREHAADLWACAAVLAAWAVGWLLAFLAQNQSNPAPFGLWAFFAVTAGLSMLALAVAVRRRQRAER